MREEVEVQSPMVAWKIWNLNLKYDTNELDIYDSVNWNEVGERGQS